MTDSKTSKMICMSPELADKAHELICNTVGSDGSPSYELQMDLRQWLVDVANYRASSPSPLAQSLLDRVVGTNLGLFLTSAVDHIEKGGNVASAQTTLTDGTKVEVRVSRLGVRAPRAGSDSKRAAGRKPV